MRIEINAIPLLPLASLICGDGGLGCSPGKYAKFSVIFSNCKIILETVSFIKL